MPFAGYFSSCDPGETQPYSIDFANQLSGDSIVSIAATLAADQGADARASSWLLASSFSDTVCTAMIGGALPNGLQPGVTYRLMFTVTTADGRTLSDYAFIPCAPIT